MGTEEHVVTALPEVIQPTALEAQERALIDIQISTAKAYPRDLARVQKNIIATATMDRETAGGCFYSLKRWDSRNNQNKWFHGESVRLAEIALTHFGNTRSEARIIDVGTEFVTAQAMAWDLEANNAVRYEVKRRITSRDGRRFSTDMIGTTCNAACAIAWRNADFKIIPKSLIKPVWDACLDKICGTEEELPDQRAKVLKYFAEAGVDEAKMLQYLGRRAIGEITRLDVMTLFGVVTAIRDGDTTLQEQFGVGGELKRPQAKSKKATAKPATVSPQVDAPAEADEPKLLNEAQRKMITDAIKAASSVHTEDELEAYLANTVGGGLNDVTVPFLETVLDWIQGK